MQCNWVINQRRDRVYPGQTQWGYKSSEGLFDIQIKVLETRGQEQCSLPNKKPTDPGSLYRGELHIGPRRQLSVQPVILWQERQWFLNIKYFPH